VKLLKVPRLHGTPHNRRILVLCGDSQVGLWVVRSLARNGLTVLSVCRSDQGLAAHSRYSAGAWALDSGLTPERFVDEIKNLAREYDVASIMPIDEAHHAALISRRSRFRHNIHLFSPPAKCFRKATDKAYLHRLCRRLGIPVADGTTLDKLMAQSGSLSLKFPLVLRTSNQNLPGGTQRTPFKAAYARDRDQLQKLYESLSEIAANVLVQEYHCGVEDHIQILMHQGQPFMVGEYYGEHHMPLAGGVTVQRVSCRHPSLARDAVRLLQAIDWQGIAAVQYHYDPDTGKYYASDRNLF
jgi:predicted ATP-grasp superfamily ATP-dependent carboligase